MRHAEGTLRLYPVKALPVELNAVTRTARRDRVTMINQQWLRNVAFKSEPMGLQVTAIGTGGEQVHGDIMSAVARHRQVECLGQMRNLQERGNPAAICNVRLGKGNATAIDVVLELPNRSEVLAGGDRQSAFANDAGVPFRILRNLSLIHI